MKNWQPMETFHGYKSQNKPNYHSVTNLPTYYNHLGMFSLSFFFPIGVYPKHNNCLLKVLGTVRDIIGHNAICKFGFFSLW